MRRRLTRTWWRTAAFQARANTSKYKTCEAIENRSINGCPLPVRFLPYIRTYTQYSTERLPQTTDHQTVGGQVPSSKLIYDLVSVALICVVLHKFSQLVRFILLTTTPTPVEVVILQSFSTTVFYARLLLFSSGHVPPRALLIKSIHTVSLYEFYHFYQGQDFEETQPRWKRLTCVLHIPGFGHDRKWPSRLMCAKNCGWKRQSTDACARLIPYHTSLYTKNRMIKRSGLSAGAR